MKMKTSVKVVIIVLVAAAVYQVYTNVTATYGSKQRPLVQRGERHNTSALRDLHALWKAAAALRSRPVIADRRMLKRRSEARASSLDNPSEAPPPVKETAGELAESLNSLLKTPVTPTIPTLLTGASKGASSASSNAYAGASGARRDDLLLPGCPDTPPGLVGFRAANQTLVSPQVLQKRFHYLKPGGDYRPSECRPGQRLAIIIPYRNRWSHLHVLLNNLVPFLGRQQASYTIFVIEQELPSTFNRAMLLNVGVVEALKRDVYTCFLFHDVDLIPLDDRHDYRCGAQPRHMANAINKFNYTLPYPYYFGGVVAMSRDQLLAVNGNSNLYFGWGGEDDDLFYRVEEKGMTVSRDPEHIARYDMIQHEVDKGNSANRKRMYLLESSLRRMNEDGLNSLMYRVDSAEQKPLYTWIKISVNEIDMMKYSPKSVRGIFEDILHPPKMDKEPPAQAQLPTEKQLQNAAREKLLFQQGFAAQRHAKRA